MIQSNDLVIAAKKLLKRAVASTIPYVPNGMTLSGMDCQGLNEYLLILCGLDKAEVNLAGSNAHWRKSGKWTGTIEEAVKLFGGIPPGAWLFIWSPGYNSKYKDNEGDASHMGQYIEGTVAIHASSSRKQVAESYIGKKTINGGWGYVMLSKWVRFSDAVEAKIGTLSGSNAINSESSSGNSVSNDDNSVSINEKVVITMTTAKVVTSGGILNMRSTPASSGKDIGDIPNGASVQVIEKTNNDFWKVRYGGVECYAAVAYLSEMPPVTFELDRDTAEALHDALSKALA